MKKLTPFLLFIVLLAPLASFCQQQPDQQPATNNSKPPSKQHKSLGFGIKAGFNFSNVTNASEVNGSSRTGYHFGIFLAPSSKSILGSRTELIYSRHGYNYSDSSSSTNGSVNLDYIQLAQLLAINITKYVQIQLGAQTSYLLNAKADTMPSTGNAMVDQTLSYYNRLDYGYCVGVEIHPVMGLLIGARYSVSLNNLYKAPSFSPGAGGAPPSFVPSSSSVNLKNNVVQVFMGWRF